jgi:hypothetical protein
MGYCGHCGNFGCHKSWNNSISWVTLSLSKRMMMLSLLSMKVGYPLSNPEHGMPWHFLWHLFTWRYVSGPQLIRDSLLSCLYCLRRGWQHFPGLTGHGDLRNKKMRSEGSSRMGYGAVAVVKMLPTSRRGLMPSSAVSVMFNCGDPKSVCSKFLEMSITFIDRHGVVSQKTRIIICTRREKFGSRKVFCVCIHSTCSWTRQNMPHMDASATRRQHCSDFPSFLSFLLGN